MKTKARILDHPIHPMLVSLPIASVLGALISDIITKSGFFPGWYFIGYILTFTAWATGLLAAIPGLIDYFTIPAKTRAKRDATAHMLLNLSVVSLFFISWMVKRSAGGPQATTSSMVLEILATCLLVVSGWLGWTLVSKHRIGIDEALPEGEFREEKRRIA